MKNRKVRQLKAHIGVQLTGLVSNGIGAEKHQVDMEVTPIGVLIKQKKNGNESLIPFANIQQLDLYPEAAEPKAKA